MAKEIIIAGLDRFTEQDKEVPCSLCKKPCYLMNDWSDKRKTDVICLKCAVENNYLKDGKSVLDKRAVRKLAELFSITEVEAKRLAIKVLKERMGIEDFEIMGGAY